MLISPEDVYLSLGSNIQPEENLPRALRLLARQVEVVAVSRVWETPPEGVEGPAFCNAAAHIRTPLSAKQLKWEVLRPIETALGRVRGDDKFAPRPIDLDIILYAGKVLEPDLWRFAYLAIPLADLLPECRHPVSGTRLSQIAQRMFPHAHFQERPDIPFEV
ncbi:MAG: 2-amino-4-hydroxy-6-hydroxymethyldihydropteridine diphosphokinase [Anaerolineae bacterium]|nr:MAG: 2-amino-4-hydroxy-6-hydroxymethyldihydropteridine diphosphokinase [Anaerolineae bacterium]